MLALLVGTGANAQQGNPFEGNPEAIRAGGPLYAARCADCHSADARGIRGPDLTQLWSSGRTDAGIFATVRGGVANTIMPASQAPDDEIWAIIAYLRSISVVPPFAVPGGDPARGRALFAEECSGCHRIGAEGGAMGPDLSVIAMSRSREALERSIREPDEVIAPGYRAVRIVTAADDLVEGIVKREDAFSIQILDADQRLQGYSKRSLRSFERGTGSMMPQFGRRQLSASRMEDLLAYLATLRSD